MLADLAIDLLVLLVSVLAALAGVAYLGLPILARRSLWQSARPTLEPIARRRELTPDDVRRFFDEAADRLEPIGFVPLTELILDDHAPMVRSCLKVMANGTEHVTALVVALDELVVAGRRASTKPKSRHVELSTRFADGSLIGTSNSDEDPVWGPEPGRSQYQLPQVGDLARLQRVHLALVVRHAGSREKLAPIAEPAAEIRAGVAHDLDQKARAGLLYFDADQRAYLPTWKSAFLVTWKLSWPFKQLRRVLRHRRAERLLRELGI